MKTYNSKLSSYILASILVAAAVLRFNHINQPFTDYINWRQASTAMMADNFYRRNWNIFYPEISWDGPGPSYNGREFQTITYIAALLYRLVGQHDWVGRSVAVMFGLWGVFALYQLVRRVWGEEHALVAAAVMALLPGSIFIERSFIPDPAMVSLVTTSFWFLVAYLQTNRLRYLILASVIGSWGFLSKITGLIVGIPMLYATFVLFKHKLSHPSDRLIKFSVAAVLTLTPVVIYYLWARHLSLTYPPYHFAGSGFWVWDDGIKKWLSEKYFLPGAFWVFDSWLWTRPIILLVGLGLLFPPPGTKHHQKREADSLTEDPILENFSAKAPWLFHWWILAGVIFYLVGAKELVFNSWNMHILNPAAAALAGHATISLASFAGRLMRLPAFLAVLAAILLTVGGIGQSSLKDMYDPLRGDHNATQSYEMGLFLRQVSQPNDLVVTVANDIGSPTAIYYSQRRGWIFPPAASGFWGQFPEDDSDSIAIFEELRAKGADWFGIVSEHTQELWEEHPILASHIESTCELESETPDWIVYRILPLKQTQL
jgi:uncharacterized membrane protein YuzA (DUF378 family)